MKAEFKKIISAVTAGFLLTTSIPVTHASLLTAEKVTLIVRTDGDAVMARGAVSGSGITAYSESEEAKAAEEEILSVQKTVQSDIKRIDRKAEVGYTYTYLLNGFSVTVDKSDIEKIKALPEVRDVWIAREYTIDDTNPVTLDEAEAIADSCCAMIGADDAHAAGYRGEGTVIAIVDSEFDVNHEFLSAELDDPSQAALTKDKIKNIVNEGKLNVAVTANRVYHNSKIPFAYNYVTNNADTYAADKQVIHGSHVAGIAAGKNGRLQDGSRFDGVAPEAQLVLMSISTGGGNLSDEKAVAAIDDAAKLGADAVNLSFGAAYQYYDGAIAEVIASARENGIIISAAAGNAGRGSKNGAQIPVEIIDYSASGSPAVGTGATSVASVNNRKTTPYTMAWSTSWGADVSLELKPDITTPGGSIYSSVPDDNYQIKSGTSMAAPHMAGAGALMKQFVNKTYPDYEGNKADLIENLAMSTADILYQNETEKIPYSPRHQGAGLLNMADAIKTPVILTGGDGRSKLSLGEIDNSFNIKFAAKNLTDTDAVYDKLEVIAMTDSYKTGNGGSYVSDSRLLTHDELLLPERVTVPANDTADVGFTVVLDEEEMAENNSIFTNGFFVEGYVTLSDTAGTLPEVHIPYMGFYGGWDSEPVFDKPYHSGESVVGKTGIMSFLSDDDAGDIDNLFIMGKNPVLELLSSANPELYNSKYVQNAEQYEGEEYAGYSPNGDGFMDSLFIITSPLRTTSDWMVDVTRDNDGAQVFSENSSDTSPYLEKFLTNYFRLRTLLDEGSYTASVSGRLAYDKEELRRQNVEMSFYSDITPPEFTGYSITEENGSIYLTVSAEDNKYIAGFEITAQGDGGDTQQLLVPTLPSPEQESVKINITGADLDSMRVYVYDYAMNKTMYTDGDFEVTVKSISGDSAIMTVVASVKNKTGESVKADVIAAMYDSEGALVGVRVEKERTVEAGENLVPFVFTRLSDNASVVQVMLWDSIKTMIPLCSTE